MTFNPNWPSSNDAAEQNETREAIIEYPNPVFKSTEYVVEHADHVSIDKAKIAAYAESFKIPEHTNWMKDSFDLENLSEEERAMLSTVFNSVSFSYWGEPYWQVEYKGVKYDRASWSLVASILRSRDEGRSLMDPGVISSITRDELAHALRGTTEIPMLNERLDILNRVGAKIQERGSILAILSQADGDALKLVDVIQDTFSPCFDDQYEYKGETVYFNKRAQALVESIHSMFDGKEVGDFQNVNHLSALADYIIPNLLRNEGILKYSDELTRKIDAGEEVEKGSAHEVEMRASVVWAIEWLRQELAARLGHGIETAAVNDGLWLKGGDIKTPFHRTRTTAY